MNNKFVSKNIGCHSLILLCSIKEIQCRIADSRIGYQFFFFNFPHYSEGVKAVHIIIKLRGARLVA